MNINEKKMQIVIDNYFKKECGVNTSIKNAFEKGFKLGLKKCEILQNPIVKIIKHDATITDTEGNKYFRTEYLCGKCKKKVLGGDDYCSHCGSKLEWSEMSMYGESTPAYVKEDLFDYMKGFLEGYPLSELMAVLTDVIETIEWEKAKNE